MNCFFVSCEVAENPDLKGKNIVNPIATILSAAMMLKYSFGKNEACTNIEQAVKNVLKKGYRTPDISCNMSITVGTTEIGDLIVKEILN